MLNTKEIQDFKRIFASGDRVLASDLKGSGVLLGRSSRWPGGAGSCGNAGWVVRGETSCPGSTHYEIEPEISALPGPFSEA